MIVENVMRQRFPCRRPVLLYQCGQDFVVLPHGFNRNVVVKIFPLKQPPVVASLACEKFRDVRVVGGGYQVFVERLVDAQLGAR